MVTLVTCIFLNECLALSKHLVRESLEYQCQ